MRTGIPAGYSAWDVKSAALSDLFAIAVGRRFFHWIWAKFLLRKVIGTNVAVVGPKEPAVPSSALPNAQQAWRDVIGVLHVDLILHPGSVAGDTIFDEVDVLVEWCRQAINSAVITPPVGEKNQSAVLSSLLDRFVDAGESEECGTGAFTTGKYSVYYGKSAV